MNWIDLVSFSQLDDIVSLSADKPVVIFKHSTRCNVSSIALTRLLKAGPVNETPFYFLDLISHRQLSGLIAEKFQVSHESPQLLLIKNGECVYEESHLGINAGELLEQIKAN